MFLRYFQLRFGPQRLKLTRVPALLWAMLSACMSQPSPPVTSGTRQLRAVLSLDGTKFCPGCHRWAGAPVRRRVKWHLEVLWEAIVLLVPSVVAELVFLCSWYVARVEDKVAFALHPQTQLSSAHRQPFHGRLRHNQRPRFCAQALMLLQPRR